MEIKNIIFEGNAESKLSAYPNESVNMCVTSPPYYGLRDYGTAKWEGGDPNCSHVREGKNTAKDGYVKSRTNIESGSGDSIYKKTCPKCGAKRIDEQIGLEETPEEYIQRLVLVFREIRRILKNDGTLWLNLGDSYCGSGVNNGESNPGLSNNAKRGDHTKSKRPNSKVDGLKPKDLIGIPWMLAFALRADGWWLRQDIIWNKPNPMPESVTDRCTKSHEYIFLLSKSKKYYYDHKAILEKANFDGRKDTMMKGSEKYANGHSPTDGNPNTLAVVGHERWINKLENGDAARNKRSVWTVATRPFKDAHYATFPEELIEPCILAGCPIDGIVIDPFMGAGTTAVVAKKLNRFYTGIELNPENIKLIDRRMSNEFGLFK